MTISRWALVSFCNPCFTSQVKTNHRIVDLTFHILVSKFPAGVLFRMTVLRFALAASSSTSSSDKLRLARLVSVIGDVPSCIEMAK